MSRCNAPRHYLQCSTYTTYNMSNSSKYLSTIPTFQYPTYLSYYMAIKWGIVQYMVSYLYTRKLSSNKRLWDTNRQARKEHQMNVIWMLAYLKGLFWDLLLFIIYSFDRQIYGYSIIFSRYEMCTVQSFFIDNFNAVYFEFSHSLSLSLPPHLQLP